MKKLFILLMLLITTNVYAASLGEVLEWKYGACSGTTQANEYDTSVNPKMVISYWKCGAPQPTEQEINQLYIDYEADKILKEQEKEAKKDEVLLKLKLTEEDFLGLLDAFGVNHK